MAVLSDIHGILPALDRVLAEPAVSSADVIVVAGDHTWGPQPIEVLDRLVSLGPTALLIRGNADRELLQMSRGLDVGLADDPLSVWGAAQLQRHHQELLDAMPEAITLTIDGFDQTLFCHATPRDDEEVVLVDSSVERWTEVLGDLPDSVGTVVLGHTHMPFVRTIMGRLIVNPGSVGLPYGPAGAHWAVLARGAVTLGRTHIDPEELIRELSETSTLPNIERWAAAQFRTPPSDLDALHMFGQRDGR